MPFFTMRRINILIGLLVVVVGIGLVFWLKLGVQSPPAAPPQTQAQAPSQSSDAQKKASPPADVSKLPPEVGQAIAQGGPTGTAGTAGTTGIGGAGPGEVRQPIVHTPEKKSSLPEPPPPSAVKMEPGPASPAPPVVPPALPATATPARQEFGPPADATRPAQPAVAPQTEPKAAQPLNALTLSPSKESAPPPAMSALSQTLQNASKKTKTSLKASVPAQPASKEAPPPSAAPKAPAGKEKPPKNAQQAQASAKGKPDPTPAPVAAPKMEPKKPVDKKATLQAPKAAKRTPPPAAPAVEPPSQTAVRQSGQAASLSLPFAVGHTRLNRAERRALRAFVKPLRDKIESIQIDGHTCTLGASEVNQRISEQRAASVALLIRRLTGLDESRVHVKGYGETKPLCTEETPACRKKNRRVEITLALRGVSLREGAPSDLAAQYAPGEALSRPGSPAAPRANASPSERPAAAAAPGAPSPGRTPPRGEYGPTPKESPAGASGAAPTPDAASKKAPSANTSAPAAPTKSAAPAKPGAESGKTAPGRPSGEKKTPVTSSIDSLPDTRKAAPGMAPLAVDEKRPKPFFAPRSGLAANKASARAAAYGLSVLLSRGETENG